MVDWMILWSRVGWMLDGDGMDSGSRGLAVLDIMVPWSLVFGLRSQVGWKDNWMIPGSCGFFGVDIMVLWSLAFAIQRNGSMVGLELCRLLWFDMVSGLWSLVPHRMDGWLVSSSLWSYWLLCSR